MKLSEDKIGEKARPKEDEAAFQTIWDREKKVGSSIGKIAENHGVREAIGEAREKLGMRMGFMPLAR